MSEDPWKDRSAGMCCSTCMWFIEKTPSDNSDFIETMVGRCRRRAPTMNGYPVVFETDWCGDHKLNENSI